MNACILFILLNGSMWATDGCWSPNGIMRAPQDVVYTQRLPYLYTTQVYQPPRRWANQWRPLARSWRNWDNYRYTPRQGRRWIKHRRWLNQRQGRNWNQGYRQGRRDGRRWNRGYRRGYRQGRRAGSAARQNMARNNGRNGRKAHKKRKKRNKRKNRRN